MHYFFKASRGSMTRVTLANRMFFLSKNIVKFWLCPFPSTHTTSSALATSCDYIHPLCLIHFHTINMCPLLFPHTTMDYVLVVNFTSTHIFLRFISDSLLSIFFLVMYKRLLLTLGPY